jgi:hypothetical protein
MKHLLSPTARPVRLGLGILALLLVAAVLVQTGFAQQVIQLVIPDPDQPAAPAPQAEAAAPAAAANPDEAAASPGFIATGPDTDGYTGEQPAAVAPQPVAPGDLDYNPAPGNQQFYIAPDAPDFEGEAVEGWTVILPYFAAGSTLHSADYTMIEDYQPGACLSSNNAAADFYTLMLDLPDGARIDYLRIYYYDTNANNSTANIRYYDANGGTTEIATVDSSGAGGYGTVLSSYINHIYDATNGGYVLNYWPKVTGTTMRLCALRVAYRLPIQ